MRRTITTCSGRGGSAAALRAGLSGVRRLRNCIHRLTLIVMPALVAGIHVFGGSEKDVDARDKPAHDDLKWCG
jgi:hypothetical protein